MTVRKNMIATREFMGLSLEEMAKKCRVSRLLLSMVEEGDVTHPNLAKRIKKAYGLTPLEAEELLPLNRREHGDSYEPDRYVIRDVEYKWQGCPSRDMKAFQQRKKEYLREKREHDARLVTATNRGAV